MFQSMVKRNKQEQIKRLQNLKDQWDEYRKEKKRNEEYNRDDVLSSLIEEKINCQENGVCDDNWDQKTQSWYTDTMNIFKGSRVDYYKSRYAKRLLIFNKKELHYPLIFYY